MISIQRVLHFFIGTEAELMKLFPVIVEAKRRGYRCTLIANGQNDCRLSPFLALVGETDVTLDICAERPASKSSLHYILWMLRTARGGVPKIRAFIRGIPDAQHLMVVHGDTLSTAMGAWIARKSGLPYVHIESGLRSFNFLSPFPEELDRLYGSLHSVLNFCPGKAYAAYAAKRFRGEAVDTVYNTGMETLHYFVDDNGQSRHPQMPETPYFMFMIHRQENLLSRDFMVNTVEHVARLAEKMPCVFIYHQQSREAMEKFGVYGRLADHPQVTLLPRQGYGNFVRLVSQSQFVISDGCGNQQEFYYLGKPYLIMRTSVEESSEGLNHNAMVFGGEYGNIERFLTLYPQYTKPPIVPEAQPSRIILDSLDAYFARDRA